MKLDLTVLYDTLSPCVNKIDILSDFDGRCRTIFKDLIFILSLITPNFIPIIGLETIMVFNRVLSDC